MFGKMMSSENYTDSNDAKDLYGNAAFSGILRPALDRFTQDDMLCSVDGRLHLGGQESRPCLIDLLLQSADRISGSGLCTNLEDSDEAGVDSVAHVKKSLVVETPPRDAHIALPVNDSPSGFVYARSPDVTVGTPASAEQDLLLNIFGPHTKIVDPPSFSPLSTDHTKESMLVQQFLVSGAQETAPTSRKRKKLAALAPLAPLGPPRLPPYGPGVLRVPPAPPCVLSALLRVPPAPPPALRAKSDKLSDTQVRMLFAALKPGGVFYHGGDLRVGKVDIINGAFGFKTSRENINNILALGSRVLATYTLWDLQDAETYMSMSIAVPCRGCLRVNKKRMFGWMCNHKKGSHGKDSNHDEYIKIFPGGRPSKNLATRNFAASPVEYSSDPYAY